MSETPTDLTDIQARMAAAFRAVYAAAANVDEAAKLVKEAVGRKTLAEYALKDAEMAYLRAGATDAGKNAEQRTAILHGLTVAERTAKVQAEQTQWAAEIAQIAADQELVLARLVLDEQKNTLRLAELLVKAGDFSVDARELPF